MSDVVTIPPVPEGRDLLRATGRSVITAAAGTGIGSATARRCLQEGASVLVSDHHEQRLRGDPRRARRRTAPKRVAAIVCDVTVEDQVEALLDGCREQFGRFDVLVNNAGLGGTASLLEMTDEQWSRVLDVTLNGTFRGTRAALRRFAERRHPRGRSSTTPR